MGTQTGGVGGIGKMENKVKTIRQIGSPKEKKKRSCF